MSNFYKQIDVSGGWGDGEDVGFVPIGIKLVLHDDGPVSFSFDGGITTHGILGPSGTRPMEVQIDRDHKSRIWLANLEELLVDGDMEAVGVAAWNAVNAVLTKQTTDPYEGLQCLRVAKSLAGPGWARQDILTFGVKYRCTGYARGNGISNPAIGTTTTTLWQGTPSNEWQHFDVVFTEDGAGWMYFGAQGGASSNYAEFDLCSVIQADWNASIWAWS